jgi:dynein heavy chain 1
MDASAFDASQEGEQRQRQAQLSSIVSYLANLLPLLLSASQIDLQNSVLNPADRAQYAGPLLLRFANEPSLQSIYINKHTHNNTSSAALPKVRHTDAEYITTEQDEVSPELASSEAAGKFAYTITTSLSWHSNNVASLALIKRVPTLDTSRSLSDQLHFINLFGPAISNASSAAPSVDSVGAAGAKVAEDAQDSTRPAAAGQAAAASSNPYESLHSIVHLAVQPYFDAYVSRKTTSSSTTTGADDLGDSTNGVNGTIVKKSSSSSTTNNNANSAQDSANTGIPVAKKKFAELELSLLHLQQNVEIPEIVLGVHPVVLRAVEKVGRHSQACLS